MGQLWMGEPSPIFKSWCQSKYGGQSATVEFYVGSTKVAEKSITGAITAADIPGEKTDLTEVHITSGKVAIADGCFDGCTSLRIVATFPIDIESTEPIEITSIGENAFNRCLGEEVQSFNVVVGWATTNVCTLKNTNAFSNIDYYEIAVPKGMLATYQAAPVWNTISSHIVEGAI